MANEEHVAILKQGVDVWNKWRKDNPRISPELSDANLSGANLSGANLYAANLYGANLYEVNLSGSILIHANLSSANLHRADFSEADLSHVVLSHANLLNTKFRNTNLRYANFRYVTFHYTSLEGADLREADLNKSYLGETSLNGADLTNTRIGWTTFGNIDLSETKGVETIKHDGPSSISLDTIYLSKGSIPYKFLLDAGVPNDHIPYLLSLGGKAIDFYSCFISYSGRDQEFAERLHADLQAKGVRCWFAPHNIQGGKKVHEQIDQAIRVYDKLLLIISKNSMDSEWVKTEVYNARQQEAKENKRKLFPISLIEYEQICQWQAFDADIGKDMAREVREYYIPDFTKWEQHTDYQKAFERLMRDLKAEG